MDLFNTMGSSSVRRDIPTQPHTNTWLTNQVEQLRDEGGSALSHSHSLSERQASFTSILAQKASVASSSLPAETPDEAKAASIKQAQQAAEQLVSIALVQPIFQRLRASNQAAPPFGPGDTEKAFGGLLDAQMSERITKSGRWDLVNSVADRLVAKLNTQGSEP